MQRFDVAVIGAGPAGTTAGRLLAEWGYSVAILTGRTGRNPSLAESLPPSCRKLFRFLGILDDIDAAGFYRSSGNTVWWGASEGRIERFAGPPGDRGYQVLRQQFDSLLLGLAKRGGASILENTMARTHERSNPEGAVLEFDLANGQKEHLAARFVLDCSGRSGVIARKGLRARESNLVTLALAGIWRCANGWPAPDSSHTLVETYDEGWAWSVPVSENTRYVTFMVDALEGECARAEGLPARYKAELAKTRRFRELVSTAMLGTQPWGSDASLYSSTSYASPQFLLVGDAGSFIDPLSSFGVKKALASAWVAALVVNTCFRHPERSSMACDFFSTRERQVYASYLRQAVRYFSLAAAQHPTAFWKKRAGTEVDIHQWDPDEEELKSDPDVLRAFEELKRCESIRFIPASEVRVEERPGIAGREIVLEEAIVAPGMNAGIRFLGGVNLTSLLRIAADYTDVPDLFEAYNRRDPHVSLENFLGVLSVLVAKRIVEIR